MGRVGTLCAQEGTAYWLFWLSLASILKRIWRIPRKPKDIKFICRVMIDFPCKVCYNNTIWTNNVPLYRYFSRFVEKSGEEKKTRTERQQLLPGKLRKSSEITEDNAT